MRAITTSIFIATSKSAHYEAGRESCGGAAGCACDVDDIEKSAAQSFKGLLTAGAGFTVALGSKVQLRVEVQDFDRLPQRRAHASAGSEVWKSAE